MILLSILTLLLITNSANSTSTTTMQVQPETCYVSSIGLNFTININIVNVTDLWCWEFQLFYSSIHLNGTAVEEGPFLKKAGETYFFTANFTDNYDATHGYIDAVCALQKVIPGAKGNGTLATITFKSKARGSSALNLTYTLLINSKNVEMPHERRGGIVIIGRPGDFVGKGYPVYAPPDGKVDFNDQMCFVDAFFAKYGIPPPSPECVSWCDLTGQGYPPLSAPDGTVNFNDQMCFVDCFFAQYGIPPPW